MSPCPACARSSLVELAVRENVSVELCQTCKGLLLDEPALAQLLGVTDPASADLFALTEARGRRALAPCLRCNTDNWRGGAVAGAAQAGHARCDTCGMLWFEAGELDRLQRTWLDHKRRARTTVSAAPADATTSEAALRLPALTRELLESELLQQAVAAAKALAEPRVVPEPFGRVSFERGLGNLLGAPLALGLSLLFVASPLGRMVSWLASMPFHELGHALTSWLGSRWAVPLPFFTIWLDEQSLLVGLGVSSALLALAWLSWRERRRFGVALALVLLVVQLGCSWLLPPRSSLMLQILGGALGELVLGALVLIAFHFPLPDRLRWDFWRWPALLPGSVCFGQALLLWIRAERDTRQIPWGAAIGNESDGDMNRLVRDFGWSAAELSSFYLRVAVLCALALALAYAAAWRRYRQARTAPAA